MQIRDIDKDHDPFDPFRVHSNTTVANTPVGFRLVPILWSNGPDGLNDVVSERDLTALPPPPFMYPMDTSLGAGLGILNPYARISTQYGVGEGQVAPNFGWRDNIHSHLIEGR